MIEELEERRPGIGKIAQEIQAEHPHWKPERVEAAAKELWYIRNPQTPKERADEFKEAARPLIKWMAENLHPHHTAIVTNIGAELLEGQTSTGRMLDYIKE